MRRFILEIVLFSFFAIAIGEVVVRILKLVPDIPERTIDSHGIQRYKQGQSGYYTKATAKWHVNEYGWLGVADTESDTVVSIIGDSFIENIMNPIECNQGSYLKTHFPEYSFFEAGRSGVTFIEAMELTKILDMEIRPAKHIIYLNESDFLESIADVKRYSDRVQVNLKEKKILQANIASPGIKKVLYNFKLLYYLYLKYPIFVEEQNQGDALQKSVDSEQMNYLALEKLFAYVSDTYSLHNITFVFHPYTDQGIISIAQKYNINTLLLDSTDDARWDVGDHDVHWSCYGHQQVAKQVKVIL